MTNIQLQQKPQHIAKPLIKWAGGKTQLLPQILERLPENSVNNYEKLCN